ncbi:hybrid sensor histidine kinase/response regulator [Leptothoe kymatousa]|uniref:histidine kinase n=1 Tax=Leptothoe kymatousa TAU-MAC 1615 TaxID=2364775 RepID=A0ABS5Y3Q0_9CYAN|nr:hybrid sensor histidine kinase/response regulator [Leptothoe kymatousa]MBT9311999.1 hybrid sensor histidine kinase/response regulator [Leptothoe kymatousa TAU-MAC 1615]
MISEPVPPQPVPPYFLQEASELLQQMDNELQTLRQDFDVQKVHTLMRIAHTLKGAAASVGLDAIKTTTHSLEDAFKALCVPGASLSVVVEGLIFDAYACLQLLLSAQFTNSPLDESAILDRMAGIVAQFQENLGDQFGNDGYLPTSTELGFDMTQSIFEMGVAERLDDLDKLLQHPKPDTLLPFLQAQAEIFFGLAESLGLPGFGDIAQATQASLELHPGQVVDIAQAALADYRAGQAQVLKGDRTQGGAPGSVLQTLRQAAAPPAVNKSTLVYQQPEDKPNRVGKLWQFLTRPIPRTPELLHGKESSPSPGESLPSPPAIKPISVPVPHITAVPPSVAANQRVVVPPSVAEPDVTKAQVEVSEAQTEVSESQAEVSEAYTEGAESQTGVSQELPPVAGLETLGGNKVVHPHNLPTLRVSVEHLDQLNYMVGELLTQQNRQALYHDQLSVGLKALSGRLQQQQKYLYELQRRTIQDALAQTLHGQRSGVSAYQFDTLEFEQYNEFQLLMQPVLENMIQQQESFEAVELFVRHSQQLLAKQQRFVDGLRHRLLDIRMQPLGPLLQRFEPVVARLSGQYRKAVELAIEGANVRIDKAIADKLYDPLLHLMRNVFSHGIESPEIRQQRHKPEVGAIRIEASQQGRYLVIKVIDDGGGLDLEAIGKTALENRLISPQKATELSMEEMGELIFAPGFSTAGHIDDLSGRGMGLNAVRSQIEALGGHVNVASQPRQGTCFTLKIPINLTISKLLLCQSGDKYYGLMTDTVQQILMPTAKQISTRERVKFLSWRFEDQDRLVPVIALTDVLNYRANYPPSPQAVVPDKTTALNPIILIRNEGQFVGLEVDYLHDEQELAIHPLGKVVAIPAYVYGCSTLPDGKFTLVLDGTLLVQEILSNLSQAVLDIFNVPGDTIQPPVVASAQKTILIVDDSITVRNTLADTLQKAEYGVIQAKDGSEALQQLQKIQVDAILCDLEMPGMNGFDFLKVRQGTPELNAIPTIMLTSRAGAKHKTLAKELGATDYLTKPYLAPQLLAKLSAALGGAHEP